MSYDLPTSAEVAPTLADQAYDAGLIDATMRKALDWWREQYALAFMTGFSSSFDVYVDGGLDEKIASAGRVRLLTDGVPSRLRHQLQVLLTGSCDLSSVAVGDQALVSRLADFMVETKIRIELTG